MPEYKRRGGIIEMKDQEQKLSLIRNELHQLEHCRDKVMGYPLVVRMITLRIGELKHEDRSLR